MLFNVNLREPLFGLYSPPIRFFLNCVLAAFFLPRPDHSAHMNFTFLSNQTSEMESISPGHDTYLGIKSGSSWSFSKIWEAFKPSCFSFIIASFRWSKASCHLVASDFL
jgi:hypothetical protein